MEKPNILDEIHPAPLYGLEAFYASIWLDELLERLDKLNEEIPENIESIDGLQFECWVERYINFSEQIDMIKSALAGGSFADP